MRLCIEAKLAAAVAVVSIALTTGAMAQGHRSGANHFGQTSNPAVNTHMSQQADKPTISDEKVTTSSGREQRESRHEAREQREDRRDARQQRADRQEAVRQREERFQSKNKKDKTPFDGSILEVKPSN